MNIRDIGLLIKSLREFSIGKVNGFYYWNDADESDLSRLVRRHLSNPNDNERQVIRGILHEKDVRSVLDIGCGPATELGGYKTHGLDLDYVGLDRSSYMLRLAKARNPDARLVYGDMLQLPFADKSFDAVVLKHVLEHLHHYEGALREAFRVSRNLLIVDFFHTLLPFNLPILDKKGYWNNWYSRNKFETFLQSLPVNRYERMTTTGNSLQTAEIYVAIK